ncbi:MAG: 4Fe-4S dicluster domain-containing protein [Dehalococcoidia bacterium]|nr:MAG: 4Fe-4S dicluster domain-containing protein [Dehalococcoidia bacterium]
MRDRGEPIELVPVVAPGAEFRECVVGAYNRGTAEWELPADAATATSLVPPGTGAQRDFGYVAPTMPAFMAERCVGCMECVTACPDTAILGKVLEQPTLESELAGVADAETRVRARQRFGKTAKYWDAAEKRGEEPGLFGIFVDPTKCKGCGECVEVCGVHAALEMQPKTPQWLEEERQDIATYRALPETPAHFAENRTLIDMMLTERSQLYVGGAGSCMGCGEATAIRMMLAATGFMHGKESIGVVAATGCNTVYGATYPYNPYVVTWTNSLFENAPAMAMGVRMRWDQQGWHDKRLWTLGGDGAMYDIGFGSLSRLLASGMDIKVLVLDTQVYSNTGGQASTASLLSQDAKMAASGRARHGKSEHRKELATIAMMHPEVFVAQTITSDFNHFYRAIIAANEYPGPALINVYTPCQPEHGIGDDMASHQAKLARDTRTFPVFVHDPRAGSTLAERISLRGNPAIKQDWYMHPRTGEPVDFVHFARTEGRFARHFDADGKPDAALLAGQEDRLANWRLLQQLAGVA